MREITCKSNVRLYGLTPALAWIFYVLDGFVRNSSLEIPEQVVITSIYDGTHSPNSRHYRGEALDIRSKNFRTVSAKRRFRAELEDALNTHPLVTATDSTNRFRVLLESEGGVNEHFHVQVKKGAVFKGV